MLKNGGAFHDMIGKLDILGHYCNALHMDHAKVGIFQEASQKLPTEPEPHASGSADHIFLLLADFTDQMQKGACV